MKLLPSILLGLVVGIAQPPAYDLIIRGGRVLDGTGNAWIDEDAGSTSANSFRGSRISARTAA